MRQRPTCNCLARALWHPCHEGPRRAAEVRSSGGPRAGETEAALAAGALATLRTTPTLPPGSMTAAPARESSFLRVLTACCPAPVPGLASRPAADTGRPPGLEARIAGQDDLHVTATSRTAARLKVPLTTSAAHFGRIHSEEKGKARLQASSPSSPWGLTPTVDLLTGKRAVATLVGRLTWPAAIADVVAVPAGATRR
jgi:hypothetical protein